MSTDPNNETPITSNMIKRTRAKLGLSRLEFGRALGFKGSQRTVDKEIIRLERGKADLWPAKRALFLKLAKSTQNKEVGNKG